MIIFESNMGNLLWVTKNTKCVFFYGVIALDSDVWEWLFHKKCFPTFLPFFYVCQTWGVRETCERLAKESKLSTIQQGLSLIENMEATVNNTNRITEICLGGQNLTLSHCTNMWGDGFAK